MIIWLFGDRFINRWLCSIEGDGGAGAGGAPPAGSTPPGGQPGGVMDPPPGGGEPPPGEPPPGGGAPPTGDQGPYSEAGFKAWLDTQPDAVKNQPSIQRIKSFDDMATSYLSGQAMVGADKIAIPTDPNDVNGWNEVYTKLGRPNAATDYKLEPPQGQQFTDTDKKLHEAMLPVAHKLGLSQAQVAGLAEAFTGHFQGIASEASSAHAQKVEQGWSTLKSEWGAAFDQNQAIAKRAATGLQMGEAELAGLEAVLGTDGLMKMMHRLGTMISPAGFAHDGGATGKDFVATPDQAKAEIAKIDGELKELMDKHKGKGNINEDPNYKQLMARRSDLFKLAYPGEGKATSL